MKKKRFSSIFFAIFTAIGIIMIICAGVLAWNFMSFQSNAEEISGIITEIESYRNSDHELSHRVYVSYQYDGKEYEDVSLGYYSSGMYEGKEIELLCDPEKPWSITTSFSGIMGSIVLLLIGIVFVLISVIPLVVMARKKRQNRKLMENGHVLHAVVENIDYNTSLRINGRHPYVIICSYRDEYKDITYRFKSKNLWTDPSVVFPVGSNIDVYVMPDNFKKYYVKAEPVLEERVVDLT